jgi:hypothetical protein
MADPQPDDRVVLGIHTNTPPGASLTDGHAWLTITRNGHTEAYGLWPNSHPRFASEDPHPESNIRRGIENGFAATASRYYELNPQQVREFEAAIRENVTWGYTNTCASWASQTAQRVTGERIDASELLGVTDTPRQIYESIQELERRQPTNPGTPLPPIDPAQNRSSSSLADATPPARTGDAQADALLAAANDPQALGQAMRNLAASPEGQAFRAEGREQIAALQAQEQPAIAAPQPEPAQTAEQQASPVRRL